MKTPQLLGSLFFSISLLAVGSTATAQDAPVPAPSATPAPSPAPSSSPAAPRTVVVGTHSVAPFVIHNADGSYSGISIELWNRVAERLGLRSEIRELPIPELVNGTNPDVDVTVSLNINAAREATFDMSHAFYTTGLAIAVVPKEQTLWQTITTKVFTTPVMLGVLGVIALMFFAALVMWRLEHRDNPDEFAGNQGIIAGLMWATETVIGYNDPTHKTRIGRAFGIMWAIFGVILVSTLTAQLASQLTVGQLESQVRGVDDLPKVRVGTVEPSEGAKFCQRRGLRYRGYQDAEAALAALAKGELDAVVYEQPILAYFAKQKFPSVQILPGTFQNHGYGFGLRAGSPLREDVNRAVLDISASDEWQGVLGRYLGGS